MLIFIDTEFTDFAHCELISIALVSDDGQHEFYEPRGQEFKSLRARHIQNSLME